MKTLSNILCVASCVLILGAMSAPAGAAITYDDFSTDPNIGAQWTEYAYFGSDLVTTTWNSTDQDLDLTRPAGQIGQGLYRTGSSRTATDPVTLTVKDLGRTSNTWGFLGLMISAAPQPGYITTGDDTYTLRMQPTGPANPTQFNFQVTRTYLDGTSNYLLYDGPDETFTGPYVLDIERVGDNYDFKANGATLYTTGTAAGDTYSTASKDSMVYYETVLAGDGAMTATVDDFGVPGAGPPPPLGDAYVVNVDVQGGSHAAYAGLGGAPDLPTNTYWNLLNAARRLHDHRPGVGCGLRHLRLHQYFRD